MQAPYARPCSLPACNVSSSTESLSVHSGQGGKPWQQDAHRVGDSTPTPSTDAHTTLQPVCQVTGRNPPFIHCKLGLRIAEGSTIQSDVAHSQRAAPVLRRPPATTPQPGEVIIGYRTVPAQVSLLRVTAMLSVI